MLASHTLGEAYVITSQRTDTTTTTITTGACITPHSHTPGNVFFFTDTDTVALLAHSLSVCPSVCRLPVSLVCHNMCVERVRWGGRWERRGEDSDREQLTCGTPRLPHHTGSLSASSLPNTLSLHTVSRGAPYTRPPTAAHNPRHDRIPTAPPPPRDKHKDMKDDDDRTAMGHSRH